MPHGIFAAGGAKVPTQGKKKTSSGLHVFWNKAIVSRELGPMAIQDLSFRFI